MRYGFRQGAESLTCLPVGLPASTGHQISPFLQGAYLAQLGRAKVEGKQSVLAGERCHLFPVLAAGQIRKQMGQERSEGPATADRFVYLACL